MPRPTPTPTTPLSAARACYRANLIRYRDRRALDRHARLATDGRFPDVAAHQAYLSLLGVVVADAGTVRRAETALQDALVARGVPYHRIWRLLRRLAAMTEAVARKEIP